MGRGYAALDVFTPWHVAHLPAASLILAGLHAAGIGVGALVVLQVMASTGGATLAFFMQRRLLEVAGVPLALAGTLACAFSAGVWLFATAGENNLIALAFGAASLAPALAGLKDGSRRAIIVGGLLLGLAAAFHLTLGTLWIGLLAHVAFRPRPELRRLVATLLVASVVLAAAYAPRIVLLARGPQPYGPADIVTFTGETVTGGHLFEVPFSPAAQWASVMQGVAPGPGLAAAALRLLPCAWLAAGLGALILRRADSLGRVSGAWFAGNWLIFSSWSTHEMEFSNFLIAPLAIFGTCGFASLLRTTRARDIAGATLLAVAVGVALHVGLMHVRTKLDPSTNPFRAAADMVAAHTAPGDVVLVTGIEAPRLKIYIPYFALRPSIVPELYFGPRIGGDESMRRLQAKMRAARKAGATLYAMPELVEDEPVAGVPPLFDLARVRAFVRSLAPEPAARGEDGRVMLYRLHGAP